MRAAALTAARFAGPRLSQREREHGRPVPPRLQKPRSYGRLVACTDVGGSHDYRAGDAVDQVGRGTGGATGEGEAAAGAEGAARRRGRERRQLALERLREASA